MGEAPWGPGPSHLCRNTGFRRKPSVGELEAPSAPTYCSTYRARCWGDRGRDSPWHQQFLGPSSASLPKLQADPDACLRPADGSAQGSAGVGHVHPGCNSDGLWSLKLKWVSPCCVTASLYLPRGKFTWGTGGPDREWGPGDGWTGRDTGTRAAGRKRETGRSWG